LKLLTGICAAGVGGGTLGIAPLEESLDKLLDYPCSLTSQKGGLGTGHI
jgi:hypothetical protein